MSFASVATARVQPGKEAEFEEIFRKLMAEVAAKEPQTQVYQCCRSLSEPGTYMLIEIYDDEAAHKVHEVTAYHAAAMDKLGPLFAASPEIRRLQPI